MSATNLQLTPNFVQVFANSFRWKILEVEPPMSNHIFVHNYKNNVCIKTFCKINGVVCNPNIFKAIKNRLNNLKPSLIEYLVCPICRKNF